MISCFFDSQNLTFDVFNVGNSLLQKHLVLALDEKLNFDEYIESKISTCNKLGLKLSCILLRLKSWSAKGTSLHPAFMGSLPTISHTLLDLPTQWMSSPSRK